METPHIWRQFCEHSSGGYQGVRWCISLSGRGARGDRIRHTFRSHKFRKASCIFCLLIYLWRNRIYYLTGFNMIMQFKSPSMQLRGCPFGFLRLHSLPAKIQASQWLVVQPLSTRHTVKHRARCIYSQQAIQVHFLCKPASFPRSHDVCAWIQEHWPKFYPRTPEDPSLRYNQDIGPCFVFN